MPQLSAEIQSRHARHFDDLAITLTFAEPALGIMRAMRPHRAAKFRGPPNSTADTTNEPKSRAEATSLANTMKTFTFLVTLVVWYEILVQVNVTSKILQEKNIQLDVAITILHKTTRFFSRI